LLAPITPRTTRAKASISLVKADSSTQNTTFTDSFSLIKPETPINAQHSKKNSMIIFEDETSHLEISLIEEETEEPKEFEEDSSSKIFGAKPITRSNSKLIEEYESIKKQQLNLQRIYVVPTSNSLIWNCLVFIGGGYYEKGKFKFQIHIPNNYPSGGIRIYSTSKVYHPLINIESGEVDLKALEPTDENKLVKLAIFLKSIFNESKYLEMTSSFNEEAGIRFSRNPYYFKIKAKESVRLSQNNLLNENKDQISVALEKVDLVKNIVKSIASGSEKFDDKVKNLIENIKKEVAVSN